MRRRLFLWITSAQLVPRRHASVFAQANRGEMYGLISKIIAVAGKREELIAILLGSISDMPGCLSYIVARDTTDADSIWVTEAWDNQASHEASLVLPAVKEAIAKGRPLIAGFSNRVVTVPVGGVNLAL
jgi:quinol monooxygenase YgiN